MIQTTTSIENLLNMYKTNTLTKITIPSKISDENPNIKNIEHAAILLRKAPEKNMNTLCSLLLLLSTTVNHMLYQ